MNRQTRNLLLVLTLLSTPVVIGACDSGGGTVGRPPKSNFVATAPLFGGIVLLGLAALRPRRPQLSAALAG